MWGSDYPHHDSTWPQSQQEIAPQFKRVLKVEREKIECDIITRTNCMILYHLS